MWFERDIDGIKVKLRIKNYVRTNDENWDEKWCKCDFSFYSGDWLNYHKEDVEVLLCCEIDNIIISLTDLLNNKILKEEEISFIEPDFSFKLIPKENLLDNIYLEWKVYFWNEGITGNHLSVTLDINDIKSLRTYLISIKNRPKFTNKTLILL